MQSQNPGKRGRGSAGSSGDFVNPQLESTTSPASTSDDDTSEFEEANLKGDSRKRRKVKTNEQAGAIEIDPGLYSTAAFRRPRRQCLRRELGKYEQLSPMSPGQECLKEHHAHIASAGSDLVRSTGTGFQLTPDSQATPITPGDTNANQQRVHVATVQSTNGTSTKATEQNTPQPVLSCNTSYLEASPQIPHDEGVQVKKSNKILPINAYARYGSFSDYESEYESDRREVTDMSSDKPDQTERSAQPHAKPKKSLSSQQTTLMQHFGVIKGNRTRKTAEQTKVKRTRATKGVQVPRKARVAKDDERRSLIVRLKVPKSRLKDDGQEDEATKDRDQAKADRKSGHPGCALPAKYLECEDLYNMANRLRDRTDTGSAKPLPTGKPEVWADGRQELCETLHYFRSYQSACYSTGGFVRAFMFDKIAHHRDHTDGVVVISRAGGGLTRDKDSGEMRSNKDQNEDTAIVQALKNCMKHYNPVVIITGADNPTMPSQPPHQYCVLDYFKPTHIWFEKSKKTRILRYRFEKLNPTKTSWWTPQNDKAVELGALDPPEEKQCRICSIRSLQVYLNGWMCLQPKCPAFWKIYKDDHQFHEPDEASLLYDPRFLRQKTPWPNDNHNYPLRHDNTEISRYSIPGEDTSQAFWSGIICPLCGRCNSRLNWTGWRCQCPGCNFAKIPPHSLVPAISLREPFWPLTDSFTLSRDTHSPLIDVQVSFAHGYRINKYMIPGIDGFVAHMIANKLIVSGPKGPDEMFEALQQTDIRLERRAMPNGQLKGESYCRHFTVNYGMPYKFIAATASYPFDGAAWPITTTRSRLNWAAKYLLSQHHQANLEQESVNRSPTKTKEWNEFNEVLALGYFESQKINYHDDGESGLGPTIATLSLGAPGTMRLRMKARHYHGITSTIYEDSPPLPGCEHYAARTALQPELASLRVSGDKAAYRARLKAIPRELGLKASGNAKDVLRMEVGHGDVVVMHGAAVQKYYEHAVEHAGKLRFALTCRYIDPESLAEGERPAYVVGRDEEGYDGSVMV